VRRGVEDKGETETSVRRDKRERNSISECMKRTVPKRHTRSMVAVPLVTSLSQDILRDAQQDSHVERVNGSLQDMS
jgi:predicted CopG family antitoxin